MEKRSKKSLKIMIVEDDEDNLTHYSDYLSKKGYHVIARYTKAKEQYVFLLLPLLLLLRLVVSDL